MLSPELTSVPTADVRPKVYTDIKLLIDHSWIQGPGLETRDWTLIWVQLLKEFTCVFQVYANICCTWVEDGGEGGRVVGADFSERI